MSGPQHGGAADSYYQGNQAPMQYPPQAQNANGGANQHPKYQQPPPSYGQNFQNGAPPQVSGEKLTFEQSFKIDKPKWNDLWAGILVSVLTLFTTSFLMFADMTLSVVYCNIFGILCCQWY